MGDEQARQTEMKRKEGERRVKEEKRREEERPRGQELVQQSESINNEERNNTEESLKEEENVKQYQVDEDVFASLCKKSSGNKIAKYLEYNKALLNCLDGLPLREAARCGNIEVVTTLLGTNGILVNL